MRRVNIQRDLSSIQMRLLFGIPNSGRQLSCINAWRLSSQETFLQRSVTTKPQISGSASLACWAAASQPGHMELHSIPLNGEKISWIKL